MEKEGENKTIAKFKYKGNDYEIDWLTDADFLDGYKEYDIFDGEGKDANCVGHLSSKIGQKSHLIRLAKEELTMNYE